MICIKLSFQDAVLKLLFITLKILKLIIFIDTTVYYWHHLFTLSPNDYSPSDCLCQCIDEINSWVRQNFLLLKRQKDKTEVTVFGKKVNTYIDFRVQKS